MNHEPDYYDKLAEKFFQGMWFCALNTPENLERCKKAFAEAYRWQATQNPKEKQ